MACSVCFCVVSISQTRAFSDLCVHTADVFVSNMFLRGFANVKHTTRSLVWWCCFSHFDEDTHTKVIFFDTGYFI